MSDATTLPTKSVQASPVKQLRLIRTQERPKDALLAITTGKGVQHFLIPEAALKDLAKNLMAFSSSGSSSEPQA